VNILKQEIPSYEEAQKQQKELEDAMFSMSDEDSKVCVGA
jgi:hypothetical protein